MMPIANLQSEIIGTFDEKILSKTFGMTMAYQQTQSTSKAPLQLPRGLHLAWILLLFFAIYGASLFSPPLLDDADATHANAARAMAQTGDLVTLKVNGIRYLEKAPLPYWLVAADFHLFGYNVFAVHLPMALAALALALLAYSWAAKSWEGRAALYSSTTVLTCVGVFLFTRTLIPEALLSLLMAITLYLVLQGLETRKAWPMYGAWVAMALGVLTKGLIAIVFCGCALLIYGAITGEWRRWRELRWGTGGLLFLLIAAPWHILAGLRNTGAYQGHGFFWFYFVNEHFLRFLGKRIPHDYNKLPGWLYWTLHIVWLFPWSLLWPAAAVAWWRKRGSLSAEARRSAAMLMAFSGFVLVFFAISTNQEYYTFPVYLPLAVLTATGIMYAESMQDQKMRRLILGGHIFFAIVGWGVAIALGMGLWSSRKLPYVEDIGSLLAHRGVGDYTLSMSHFFDLTGPSFAALRLPAALAAIAFAFGPSAAWWLRRKKKDIASTLALAATSAIFLIAAHIALGRFGPMLSSEPIEAHYEQLIASGQIAPDSKLMLYGDQSYGSSIAFYSGHILPLVNGQSTSMWFGSTFHDVPHIFLSNQELLDMWGKGERKVLFVPLERRDMVDALLGDHQILLMEQSGKALITDRPLQPVK